MRHCRFHHRRATLFEREVATVGVVESEWYEFQAIGAGIVDENFITGISVEPGTDVAVIVAVPVNML